MLNLSYQHGSGRKSENISVALEEAENELKHTRYLKVLFLYSEQGANGKPCPKASLGVPVPSINTFWNGNGKASSCVSGAKGWRSTTK